MYAAIAAIATYPLILQLESAIPRGGDSWQNYWNLWWVKTALLERYVSPYFMPDVHFPYGASLYFHTLNLLPAIIALPVVVVAGIPAAFNFLVFLSFVLSGYGTYRLTLYVLARAVHEPEANRSVIRLASVVGGVAFACSSYRFVHLRGHLDLLSTQWLPLYVLFLLKTRDEGGWRNTVAAGIFLAAAMFTTPYYLLFLLLFTGLASLDLVVRKGRQSARTLLQIAGVVSVFAAVAAPVLVPMLYRGLTEGRTQSPAFDIGRFSTDLVAFVVPAPLHPLWGTAVEPVYRIIGRGGGLEIVCFLGFVPLTLGLAGAIQYGTIRRFWAPMALVFAALALGPVAHFAGKALLPQLSFLMPYRLLTLLPYGDIPRVPARFAVMAMLCLSVLASAGAFAVLRRSSRAIHILLVALIAGLAIGENAAAPLPVMEPRGLAFFPQMRADRRRTGVIEVPIPDDPSSYPHRMMYQTIHTKPIYGGYLARGLPPLPFGAVPGFGQLKALSDTVDDVVIYESAELQRISIAVLNLYSAGYVVLEKHLLDPPALERARAIAEGLFGSSARVYEDTATVAYAVPSVEPSSVQTAVWLDSGWSYLERLPDPGLDGRPLRWRWMGGQARLGIISSASERIRLRFTAQAFARARRVRLSVDGLEVTSIPIATERAEYETPVFDVGPNAKFLELTSLDGADVPGEDARRLSIALLRLELVRAGR